MYGLNIPELRIRSAGYLYFCEISYIYYLRNRLHNEDLGLASCNVNVSDCIPENCNWSAPFSLQWVIIDNEEDNLNKVNKYYIIINIIVL
jgi:hypothetical protein